MGQEPHVPFFGSHLQFVGGAHDGSGVRGEGVRDDDASTFGF